MSDLTSVHNNFFLKIFQDPKNTVDFLKGAFPTQVLEIIDFDSAHTEAAGFIDESLKNHLSDLVIKFNTVTGEKADVYVLFEHKSYMDRSILWQLLKYQYLMLEEDFHAKRKFRIIIPMVFYHGKQKWTLGRNLYQSMKVPEPLKKYVINFEYMLFDTHDFDFSQHELFGRNAYLMSALSLMKEMKEMNSEKTVVFFEYLVKSGLVKDRDFILILFEYLVRTNDIEEKNIVDIITSELGSETEDIMPSLAKKWLEQGKEEGKIEGREEGIQVGIEKGAFKKAVETCRNLLSAGLNVNLISKATNLPLDKVLEIQKELG